MRRLVIDAQILQTAAYDRGMGKYTLSLLAALLEANKQRRDYNEIILIFSHNLPKSKQRFTQIKHQLPGATHVFLNLPTDISQAYDSKYTNAEKTLSKYISTLSKTPTDFLVTAPFFVDFPATFPATDAVRKFSIVYDLIPQKIWHLQRIFPDDVYFNHFKLFLAADHLFTISHAVRDDLIELIGLPKSRVTSIDGGPFQRPVSKAVGTTVLGELKQPYILMPSAPIIHKNNERAVRGFERFNRLADNRYTLYVTSNFDDETKDRLRSLSAHLVFTGNISDKALGQAFAGAAAVLFPSLVEGLGMPVLEAALYNVPVACSDIPVLNELSRDAFYQFDPTDENAIAASLFEAVNKKDWARHDRAYQTLRATYTWQRSAKLLLDGMTGTNAAHSEPTQTLQLTIPNPRHDSPAAVLGELLYAQLSSSSDVRLRFTATGATNRPSYVGYLPESDAPASSLRITNKLRGLTSLRRKRYPVKLTYKTDHSPKVRSLSLYARPILADKALQLKGWEYRNAAGQKLPPSDIIDLLTKDPRTK